jgi:hypothetical protein
VGKKLSNRCELMSRQLAARLAGAALFAISPIAQAVQFVYAGSGQPPETQPQENQVAPPLRLSQLLSPVNPRRRVLQASGDVLVDTPLGLQSSRSLGVPGVTGAGRTQQDVPGMIPPIDGSSLGQDDALVDESRPAISAAAGNNSQNREGEPRRIPWGIPPIRWGGNLGYSLQQNSSSSGARSSSQSFLANLNASSYIYAPWLATVSGRFGVVSGLSGSSSSESGGQESQNKNSSLVGGGEVNLLPSSRFPFQAYFDRSDSRASGNLVNQDYVNTRLGLRQNYRSNDGMTTAAGQLDHSIVTSSANGGDTVTAMSGSLSTDIGIVKNSVSANYSLGKRENTGEKASLFGVSSSHNASFEDNISLSGNFSYVDNNLTTGTGLGRLSNSHSQYLQVNTFGTWMPEFEDLDDLPLSLSGSLRYSTLTNEFGGQGSESQSLGGNLNGQYRFSNNLATGANVGLNYIAAGATPAILLTTAGANVSYNGDALKFGNFSYNWNTGANVNWQSAAGTTPSNSFFGLQAGHSVGRYLSISERDTVSVTLSQNVNALQNQSVGASNSLSNTLAVSYGFGWGEQFSGNSSLSVSDVSTTGVGAQNYRMLGLGISAQGQLSQVSSANVNLQFNWSEQEFNASQESGSQNSSTTSEHMSMLGSASYSNTRFIGVRGLRYALVFSADTRKRDERLFGNTQGAFEPVRFNLTNRLDYRLGLLDFRLSAIFDESGGRKNALLFFQVTRQIGAY